MNSQPRMDSQQSSRLQAAGLWLLRLQEDVLSEAELADWVEWCERDPKNLAAFDELRSLWEVSAGHLQAQAQPKTPPRRRVPVWLALAASVVLAVGAGAIFFAINQGQSERIGNGDLIRTPVAANQPGVLPDGSRFEVGGRSAVAVDFSRELRRLELRDGEAFFQVEHDTSRPFVVEAAGVRIVAVGTAFNVRRAGAQVAVTVQEGRVKVSRAVAGVHPETATQVDAGQQLVVDIRTGSMSGSPVDPAVALSWRSGRLEFIGDSLDTVVSSVNRYAARPITLGDPQLRELTFTGTVFCESIDAWLDSLQQVFPVAVDRSNPSEIVLKRRAAASRADLQQ